MKFMIVLLSFLSMSVAHANYPVNCEMKMLKVATDAYDANWKTYTELFSVSGVSFEYPADGQAAVVLTGTPNYLTKQLCSVRVEMTYPVCEECGGCPTYTFAKVTSSCQ